MKISLTKAGKRFNRDWIFRNFQYTFITGQAYAITGPNGSGKSTLLQAIGGALALSEGETLYQLPATGAAASPRTIPPDQAFRYISIAAPYLEVIEEMTVTEFLRFHQQFKPLLPGFSLHQIIEAVGLGKAAHKQIRFYSSGMKQRVKLAQAIFSNVPAVLLDEPCTNLDAEGIGLYRQLVRDHCPDRLVIVSSNDPQEYDFCTEQIRITDYR